MKAIPCTVLFLGILAQLGCASKLIVQSEPPQADVFAKIEGKVDRVKLGQTPFEMSEVQINDFLKVSSDSAHWLELTFEKKEFQSRQVLIPSNRWGETVKIVKIKLTENADQSTLAKKIVNYFFNAKKFAETKQFDQAHTEIDKILEIDGKLAQAITMKAGIYYLQGKIDDAKRLYREALTIDPGASDAIHMLEKLQAKSGASQ